MGLHAHNFWTSRIDFYQLIQSPFTIVLQPIQPNNVGSAASIGSSWQTVDEPTPYSFEWSVIQKENVGLVKKQY
jgi:hypothetical protein